MIASFVGDFAVLNFMQKNEHINLSAKIVKISDHNKLRINNNDKIPLITGLVKAGSHRSRQHQRYRSVAVTSNVKVFTQKILAVTEVIFLISSVLR